MKQLNDQLVNQIYDILIDTCEAPDGWKQFFVSAFTQHDPPREWRFQGCLGFGGKFRLTRDRCYVDCYPEDETPNRLDVISRANKQLEQLTNETKTQV